MEHDAARELTAAHALGALDADDVAALEEHLASCDRCRDELAGMVAAASALVFAVDAPPPPPALRERVLSAARAERPNVVPLRPRRAGRRVVFASLAAAAASAAAAVALAFYAAGLSDDLDRERAERAVLADPDARAVPIQGGDGRLVVTPEGAAVLITRLDPAPAGKTYELWIIRGTTPRRAGTFEGNEARDVVPVQGRVGRGAVVAVTVEPDPGVDEPTTDPFITAQT